MLVSFAEINAMSAEQYTKFLDENKAITGTAEATMVSRVGTRIAGAVQTFFQEAVQKETDPKKKAALQDSVDELKKYEWRFELVDSKEVNAWCMPGGRVVVYSGILPVAGTEAGLAVVMGHEIAHAVANHGQERMSQNLIAETGLSLLNEALSEKPEETRKLFLGAAGLGAQLGYLLPFSRVHENEADRLGLIFMALAGYDPHEAPTFWQRMAEKSTGGQPPEFLSTHPSSSTRIANLKKLADTEAAGYYRPRN